MESEQRLCGTGYFIWVYGIIEDDSQDILIRGIQNQKSSLEIDEPFEIKFYEKEIEIETQIDERTTSTKRGKEKLLKRIKL